MNKLIADKWCLALRSGEYDQCKQTLENTGAFCCLGVLCKLAEKENINVKFNLPLSSELLGGSLDDQTAVLNWADLKHGNALNDYTDASLAQINDSGADFKHIADVIEQTWEQL